MIYIFYFLQSATVVGIIDPPREYSMPSPVRKAADYFTCKHTLASSGRVYLFAEGRGSRAIFMVRFFPEGFLITLCGRLDFRRSVESDLHVPGVNCNTRTTCINRSGVQEA